MVLGKRFLIIAAAGMSAALSGHLAFADDDGSSMQAALIQAEAQAEVAKSTAAAAAALASLAEGPVHPMVVNTPANVTVAAPAAPASTSMPAIDYSKLPPDLARPVTIKWSGPVAGAIRAIAEQINYTVLSSANHLPTQPNILLDENGTPAAGLFERIGAQVAQYETISVDPNKRTVRIIAKSAS